MREQGSEIPYRFGTMIEVPRAALTADELAERAQFFSFGTNDLTQTTCGISRDDAESRLPDALHPQRHPPAEPVRHNRRGWRRAA